MSHFTMLFIQEPGDSDIEDTMEKWNEQAEVPEDERVAEEMLEEEVTDMLSHYANAIPELIRESKNGMHQLVEHMEDWNGSVGEYNEKEDKVYYYPLYNPNGKWDWYVVGGRWTGLLKAKKGVKLTDKNYGEPSFMNKDVTYKDQMCDSLRLGDIDWEGIEENNLNEAKEHYESIVNDASFTEQMREKIYGISKDETLEEYLKKHTGKPLTYGIIYQGEWLAKGEMGWFGISKDTAVDAYADMFAQIIKEAHPDSIVTVLDCHI